MDANVFELRDLRRALLLSFFKFFLFFFFYFSIFLWHVFQDFFWTVLGKKLRVLFVLVYYTAAGSYWGFGSFFSDQCSSPR